jgi:hypothetical protein
MSNVFADVIPNPYVSPRLETAPASAPVAAVAKPGSIGMILGGFVLVLVGYLMSNIFVISDLYHVGFGPDGKVIPSPFASVFSTAPQQWTLYFVCATAFIAGAVMIGSQPFNPLVVVCYVMCPLVGMIYLIATPLRIAKKYAEPIAAAYLLIGSCLVFTGATRMFLLYGQAAGGFAPVAASMMTEAGMALVLGSALRFLVTDSPSRANDAADEIVAAEIADGLPARA